MSPVMLFKPSTTLSRRSLLRRSLALGATLSLPRKVLALEAEKINVSNEAVERVAAVFAEHPIVDFHTHIGIWQNMGLDKPK